MTDPPGFGSGSRLMFHGPLSAGRADRLAAELAASAPATVADYGCGRGELLLRVLTAAPGARGTGVDIHGPDIARGRENAGKRGLADKVIFIEGSAADHGSKADAVINCGAYQAFGRIPEALKALRALVNPGGRVLFGAEIWDRTPTEEWLLANPDHPEAGQVRDRLNDRLSIWLRGHRDAMGFVYLTLGAPVTA